MPGPACAILTDADSLAVATEAPQSPDSAISIFNRVRRHPIVNRSLLPASALPLVTRAEERRGLAWVLPVISVLLPFGLLREGKEFQERVLGFQRDDKVPQRARAGLHAAG